MLRVLTALSVLFLPSQLGRIFWEGRNGLQVPVQDELAKLAPLRDGGIVLRGTKRLEQRTMLRWEARCRAPNIYCNFFLGDPRNHSIDDPFG